MSLFTFNRRRKADPVSAPAATPAAPPVGADPQAALSALDAADFNYVRQLQGIWHDPAHHVEGLNGDIAEDLARAVFACDQPQAFSPLGRVVWGDPGAGKTHLMSSLRRTVLQRGGWFLLLDFSGIRDFWPSTVLNILDSLDTPCGAFTQGQEAILRLLGAAPGSPERDSLAAAFTSPDDAILDLAERTVAALRHDHWPMLRRHQGIVRAFIMQSGRNPRAADEAMNWLQGMAVEAGPLRLPPPDPRDVVHVLSWLLSLSAPALLAVDQIDAIIAAHRHSLAAPDADAEEQRKARSIVDNLGPVREQLNRIAAGLVAGFAAGRRRVRFAG